MNSPQYPIVLVHGIVLKDVFFIRAFGRIGRALEEAGCTVFTADTDGFGTIETNAAQLKACILRVLEETGAEKVNLIAHSKGGLDAKYMLCRLGMGEKVASLTTLATPHRGAKIATWIFHLPKFLTKWIAFWVDLWYRLFRDKHPDSLAVCRQLQASPNAAIDGLTVPANIYCQSYSTTLTRSRDDFIMGIPYLITRRLEQTPSDGLVSAQSAQFGNYRGDAFSQPISHSEVAGYSLKKKNRARVCAFYCDLAKELAALGF